MNNYEKLLEIMRKQGRRDNPEHPQLARGICSVRRTKTGSGRLFDSRRNRIDRKRYSAGITNK